MSKSSLAAAIAVVMSCAFSLSVHADGPRLRAVVAGSVLPSPRVRSLAVDSDTHGIDAATITVEAGRARVPAIGDALNVDVAGGDDPADAIFKGEIVGVEPSFDAPGGATVRALNRLHRLTRGRKSRTFEQMSDSDIASAIARDAKLAFAPSGVEAATKHDRVFQHNETDLDFLRQRAARLGYSVWVDDSTLYFDRRGESRAVSLGCAPTRGSSRAYVRVFHPRTSSAGVVAKVIVRGWDPAKKEEIAATATRPVIALSSAAADARGTMVDLGSVLSLETAEASYGAAHGTLSALTAEDVSAEADADGSASLRAGARVYIAGGGEPFGGEYAVSAASHRFERGSADGWHTLLRVVRADRGLFSLPEVGDEVLVAFEHGDLAHPYVVGSLWNGKDRMPEAPFCGGGPGGR